MAKQEDYGRSFSRADHEERITDRKADAATVGGHKVEDLRRILATGGQLPPGISFSPHSAVPFVALSEKDQERIRAPKRLALEGGPVESFSAAVAASPDGSAVSTGGAGSSTGGTGGGNASGGSGRGGSSTGGSSTS